ncbi:hypothetical protein GZ77_06415 [Endozoicomonas montiporae]|uniref:Uncharacterized protein n=1 Tax=Endozoicomonas montiporae TaxID=1027273 RepID=A0A081NCB9_9GAMM|nr:hypothetical protein GZ77_09115 [Endozoicomonas montiporae]KEQ16092.1 hypothetical protein GZ77_06415 [Endozoicomonas montiporae]
MHVFIKVSLIGSPIIGVKFINTKWLQKCFEFFKNFIFPFSENISKHGICSVINSIPKPALVRFIMNIRPLLI